MKLLQFKNLAGVALISSLAMAPLAVNAADNHAPKHQQMQHKHAKYKNFSHKRMPKLDLTQEQKDKLFELRHASAKDFYEQKKAVSNASKQLRDLNKDDKFDVEKAKQITADLGQAKAQLALLRAQSKADFMSVLTAEQKQKLADFKNKKVNK